MTTLLLSSRHTEDDQLLWRAAIRRGWSIERVRGIREPEIHDEDVVVYVEALYGPTIATALGLRLLEPDEDWLTKLPHEFRKRNVTLSTLGQARHLVEPSFVKPPNDKSFEAKVYSSGADLPEDFDDSMPVFIGEPVQWDVEFRCFILDRAVQALSPYVRNGQHAELDDYFVSEEEKSNVRSFVDTMLADPIVNVPRAVAIDVGTIVGKGWAVVEANGAWGSGIYGCDPDAVLDVIRHATEKAT